MYSNVSVKLIKTYLQQIAAELPYEQLKITHLQETLLLSRLPGRIMTLFKHCYYYISLWKPFKSNYEIVYSPY